jgi:hypothetical protein
MHNFITLLALTALLLPSALGCWRPSCSRRRPAAETSAPPQKTRCPETQAFCGA